MRKDFAIGAFRSRVRQWRRSSKPLRKGMNKATMRNESVITYKQAAQQALDIQDACNLSGIAYAFERAITAVCEESHRIGQGTQWRNTHPIVTLHLLKMSELDGCGSTLHPSYDVAETECRRIVETSTEGN
jgi:hypothetical protein